ncbi:MAG: hypothetical protein BGO49_09630 [Planctomycetales bacterium 71-10]|nr:MAG: hypothetical protein BGO49_09630 [Planctomycetales bacterium 71-10]
MNLQRSSHRKAVSGPTRRRGPHISLERRIHPRRPAVDYRIWVGGWVPGGQFATVAARVEDVSRGGARILSPLPFAEGDDVWLKPGTPEYHGCVRAEVLQASVTESGDYLTRLRFLAECDDAFFEIVTKGLGA